MPLIHRLPLHLANQIAAGEVVERPASVVKELVENALDARASRVSITLELGGKKLIRVEDDGTAWMLRMRGWRLAARDEQNSQPGGLGAIATLGFRGEALPSIASVSRFTLRTRARGAGGRDGDSRRGGHGRVGRARSERREGTCIEVADLFYNVPARRKFLKSDSVGVVSGLQARHTDGPGIPGSRLHPHRRRTHGCSSALRPPAFPSASTSCSASVRISSRCTRTLAGCTVAGFVAALGDQGPVRGQQHVFVNRRIVKDRTIAHAIVAAYSVATIKERSPEVHLFIGIAPDRVDVNVHPTKAEVRFLEQSLVHEVLRRGLAEALGQGERRSCS